MDLSVRTSAHIPGPDPVAVLHHLAATSDTEIALLHSATNTSHSVLAFSPLVTLEIDAALVTCLTTPFKCDIPQNKEPLQTLQHVLRHFNFTAPHPLIGWLGFISYDIGRTLENIPALTTDNLRWPLLRWTLFRYYLLHDPSTNTWTPAAIEGNPLIPAGLLQQVPSLPSASASPAAKLVDSLPESEFHRLINRTKEYIAAGDIYQANIAQRWQVATTAAPHDIYRRLCQNSPAPYASFCRFASNRIPHHILSASPELFITLNQGRLVTRPIKGTRRRDLANPAGDEALKNELLESAKDKAELAMIVDLLRNDLGRVSEFGSVSVDEPRTLEAHPTVWHTVATISSTLRKNTPADTTPLADLLAAVCPGGSITGAPKIRAMQIIEELEGAGGNFGRRGLYCGNIGVIGPQASSLTLNIAIRTMLMQTPSKDAPAIATVHAGAGIVADSDPGLEYEETRQKARALLQSLGLSDF